MLDIAVKWFVALGGIAVIVKFAIGHTRSGVKAAIGKAVENPAFKPVLLEYREQIEAFFDEADKGLHDGLDAAATAPAPEVK
jgi:hypothetical protein